MCTCALVRDLRGKRPSQKLIYSKWFAEYQSSAVGLSPSLFKADKIKSSFYDKLSSTFIEYFYSINHCWNCDDRWGVCDLNENGENGKWRLWRQVRQITIDPWLGENKIVVFTKTLTRGSLPKVGKAVWTDLTYYI